MGIKFHCPNGHKLHVKAFLRGKRAFCPKCGVRVLVPEESETTSAILEMQEVESPLEEDVDEILSRASEVRRGAAATASPAMPVQATIPVQAAANSATVPAPLAASTVTDTTSATVTAPIAVISPPAALDPFQEAPTAVWYVRPATGGQFGPASGEIMRAWLDEGRIGANSLVWRGGWADWRSAAATFPQLGAPLASPGAVAAQPAVVTSANGSATAGTLPMGHAVQNVASGMATSETLGVPAAMPPLVKAMRKRQKNTDRSVVASAILIVVSVILVIALVWVFWLRQSAPEMNPAPAAPTAPAVPAAGAPEATSEPAAE